MGYSTPVQTKGSQGTGNSGSIALTLTSNVTVGNLITVAMSSYTGGISTTLSVTDNLGNTYTQDAQTYNATATNSIAIFRCLVTTGGACTITGHSTNSGQLSIGAAEWSGNASSSVADTAGTNTGNSTTPTSNSITPAQSGELLIGAATTDTGSTMTPGSGWTSIYFGSNNSTAQLLQMVYQVDTATSSINATWTASSGHWTTALAAYKPAAGGGGGGPMGCGCLMQHQY